MSYDSNCNGCPYKQQKHLDATQKITRVSPPVELEANDSDTLLVFQAPGDVEWTKGHAIQPIIKKGGTAGRRVQLSWKRSNKQRTDFDIINSVQCFPGNQGDRDLTPHPMAICSCSKRLEAILLSSTYEQIIVFGDIAKQVIIVICGRLNISPKVITAKHPNGGVSNVELDSLWGIANE